MEIRPSEISLEPELNPLHNPLLAENLDLWARVYASVPLEDRSQALRQLVSDLQAGKSAVAVEADISATPNHVHDFACRQCGKLNEGGQKFCGFCGAETFSAISPNAKLSEPDRELMAAQSRPVQTRAVQSPTIESFGIQQSDERPFPSLQPAQSGSAVGSRQLDSLREISFSTIYDAEESPRNGFRYTIVALVVIICVGAVSYAQWRPQMRAAWTRMMVMAGAAPANSTPSSTPTNAPAPNAAATTPQDANTNASPASTSPASTSASSSNQTAAGQTTTPSATANSQPATPSVTVQPDDGDASSQSQHAATNSPAANSSASNANASDETNANNNANDSNAPSKPAANSQTAKAEAPHRPLTPASRVDRVSTASALPIDNGSAELATAQGYLNGTSGARNSTQAATWLWKAVGKQNPTALVLLSDLYARGDGVAKNCDQARMLLVAAARKNAPDAGAKLRFVESNGCR